jgi:asparagine synthase (glutamine-hydrolysing)
VFAGYSRYGWLESYTRLVGRAPGLVRRGIAATLHALATDRIVAQHTAVARRIPALALRDVAGKLDRLAAMARASTPARTYLALVSHIDDPAALIPGASSDMAHWAHAGALKNNVEDAILTDVLTYLPDDVLVKIDRASMAVGLEARAPLLDHRLLELSRRMPSRMRRRDGVGKWVLRQVAFRYVPAALLERPKQGFAVPLAAWLRGPLRDWAESLLDEQRLLSEGLIDAPTVRRLWKAHLGGHRDHASLLWNVLMFEAWRDAQQSVSPTSAYVSERACDASVVPA